MRQPTLNIKDAVVPNKIPTVVDLRSKLPPCYDQGQLGSCTANALVGAYQYLTPEFMGSRLFLYYNERLIEGTVNYDSGAYIHDGVSSLQQKGLCPETDWPYTVSKFTQKPPTSAYTDALKHKVVTAYNVTQTVSAMKALLVAGHPFVIGITVYSSFETYTALSSGLVPMPPVNRKDSVLGGHAVLVVGYNDSIQCPGAPPGAWIFRNSWGSANGSAGGYGVSGYGFLPYNYLINTGLCSDCWYLNTDTS